MTLPLTNLQGDYSGLCVSCLRGTDTAVSFSCETEWLAAALVVLGVEEEVAIKMVEIDIVRARTPP